MKEAFWGVFIILLGAIGIVAINLFQNLTVTTDQNYYLMKETTKAAINDSLDMSYYKSYGRPRIVKEAFVENLTRRFATSAVLNKDYQIVIHDIVEDPPKVSLSLKSKVADLKGDTYNVLLTIDGIYEGAYNDKDLSGNKPIVVPYSTKGVPGKPGSKVIIDGGIENVYEDGNCPEDEEKEDSCIEGHLIFMGWEEEELDKAECPADLSKLTNKRIQAKYKECECGEYVDKKDPRDSKLNRNPKEVTYTWNFVKKGPVNTLDETISKKVVPPRVTTDLKILKTDDLRGTSAEGEECPKEGIEIIKGAEQELFPRYFPKDAVNRKLTWESSNDKIVKITGIKVGTISNPEKDNIIVKGLSTGAVTITAKDNCNVTKASCDIRVVEIDCVDISGLAVGETINVSYKKSGIVETDTSGFKFNVVNSSIAKIENDKIIALKAGKTEYTIEMSGMEIGKCKIEVKEEPDITCPPMITLKSGEKQQVVLDNIGNTTGINYKIENKSVATISSTGLIEAKSIKGETTIQYTIYTSKQTKECDLKVLGEPPPDPKKTSCSAGDIKKFNWIVDLPKMCRAAINDITIAQALTNARLNVENCGQTSGITKNCTSSWDSTSSIPLGKNGDFYSVSRNYRTDGNKYTVTVSVTVNHSVGWQNALAIGDGCSSAKTTYSFSETFTGELFTEAEMKDMGLWGELCKLKINSENLGLSCPNELMAGDSKKTVTLTGDMTNVTNITWRKDDLSNDKTKRVITDFGSTGKNTAQYISARTGTGKGTTQIIAEVTLKNGDLKKVQCVRPININPMTCDNIKMFPASAKIRVKGGNQEFRITNITEQGAAWSLSNDLSPYVEKVGCKDHLCSTLTIIGKETFLDKIIKGTLSADLESNCTTVINLPMADITVCPESDYVCTESGYPNLIPDTKKCASNEQMEDGNTLPPVCASPEITHNQKCYDRTKLSFADPKIDCGSDERQKICDDPNCNVARCIDKKASEKDKKETYTYTFTNADGKKDYGYSYATSNDATNACKAANPIAFGNPSLCTTTKIITCSQGYYRYKGECYKDYGSPESTYVCKKGDVNENRCVKDSDNDNGNKPTSCMDPNYYFNSLNNRCVRASKNDATQLSCK